MNRNQKYYFIGGLGVGLMLGALLVLGLLIGVAVVLT